MAEKYLDSIGKVKGDLYGKIKNKRQNKFVDCCKEYKFIRKANIISFNNKMNELGITHLVLDNKYNQTDVLIHDTTVPIKYGANVILGITGYTRSGKSELVETIVLELKKANKKYKSRDVKLYLCWTQADFYLTLKNLNKGDIVWRDEDPRTLGKGSNTERWAVNNVLHTIAKRENVFIFVDPKEIKIDICDLYLESAGMNFKTRTNRFMILDDERRYFGHVLVKLHNVNEFRNWYEKEKDAFVSDISDKAGKIRAAEDNIEIEQEALDEDLRDKLELLDRIYKSKNKKRNLLIWELYKKGKKFDEIDEIFDNLERRTILNIVYEISSIIKNL